MRRARARDLDLLTELWIALTEHHARLEPLFALRAGAEGEVARLLSAQLRDPSTAIFVSERAGGSLDGFCSVRIDTAPPIHAETLRAEITDVAVRDGARRRGLGRGLVRAALEWARARGAARVEVRVAAANAEGQAFWRALGFGDFMDVLHRRL